MKTNLYKKSERFAINSFKDNKNDILHAKRTVYWIKRLKPEAGEALLIAGILHDIERAFYGDWKKGSINLSQLRKHQNLSATEAAKFLRRAGAKDAFIKKVKNLVSRHEEGGDREKNILCDADCLAYFEKKSLRQAKRHIQEGREALMIKKLKFNFKRIVSPRARKIAWPFYKKALAVLSDK